MWLYSDQEKAMSITLLSWLLTAPSLFGGGMDEKSSRFGNCSRVRKCNAGSSWIGIHDAIHGILESNSKLSCRCITVMLEITASTENWVLKEAAWLYKVSVLRELTDDDLTQHVKFCRPEQHWIAAVLEFLPFTDEAAFHLEGSLNVQNTCMWSRQISRHVMTQPMHPLGVTLWCGIWRGGVMGPPHFFFSTLQPLLTHTLHASTQSLPELSGSHMQQENLIYQHGDVSAHYLEKVHSWLEQFSALIGCGSSNMLWLRCSPGLTPCVFFLCRA